MIVSAPAMIRNHLNHVVSDASPHTTRTTPTATHMRLIPSLTPEELARTDESPWLRAMLLCVRLGSVSGTVG